MEHVVPEDVSAAIRQVFGERTGIAEQYHAALSTDGVERGLIGPREVPRLWDRHILNCGVLGEIIDPEATVVDVGSGAGLPGIPLAIARPDLRITLVEPLLRRTIFLTEFVEATGLTNIRVVRGRAEEKAVIAEAGGADIVTSRAVAPLLQLATWSIPLVRTGGMMLALKGSTAAEELERDLRGMKRIGAESVDIVQCGARILATPTTVVRLRRVARARHR